MPSRFLIWLFVAALLSGCPREATLHGDTTDANGAPRPGVVDISGHGLPGVAVSIYGVDRQAVSDALGQYSLTAPRGAQQLDFIKTGYTPARVIVELEGKKSLEVPQAVMWPLPDSQGIYAFDNERYRSLTRVEPKRYLAGETQSVFASKKGAETFIDPQNMPMLIVYRLPGYDLQLCRLHQRELTPADAGPSAKGYTVPVWTVETKLAMHSRPVDSPQALLTEVVPDSALAPGDYAIHWGAFDGFGSTDARAYLFTIVGENAEDEATTEGEAAEEAEAKDAKTDEGKGKKDSKQDAEPKKDAKPKKDEKPQQPAKTKPPERGDSKQDVE